MTEHRVPAPIIDPANKPQGPASYFPSIETKYGQPIQHWLDLAAERLDGGESHMQAVGYLKTEHGMGHGHANAVVGYVKAALASQA